MLLSIGSPPLSAGAVHTRDAALLGWHTVSWVRWKPCFSSPISKSLPSPTFNSFQHANVYRGEIQPWRVCHMWFLTDIGRDTGGWCLMKISRFFLVTGAGGWGFRKAASTLPVVCYIYSRLMNACKIWIIMARHHLLLVYLLSTWCYLTFAYMKNVSQVFFLYVACWKQSNFGGSKGLEIRLPNCHASVVISPNPSE